MSSVKLPIISLVVVCDSNNEVGGEKYHVARSKISSSFCEIAETAQNRRYL